MLASWSIWGLLLLASAIEATYTTVQSRYNASHALRVKEHADGEICDGGGKHYTGWADIGARHLFYWYHPIRHGKEEDTPLLIWLQGGPGASSMLGMLMLHGPCLMNPDGNSTSFNPYSWNEEFNVLYLDQPAGVGFSYVDDTSNDDAYPRRTEESAVEFVAAVNLFYEGLPGLGRDTSALFLAGESYGGRYVPVYGEALLDWNVRAIEERRIPLVSVVIGDGWTSPRDQYPTYYDVGCYEVDGIPPVWNESVCESLPSVVERCEGLLDACVAFPDEVVCAAASDYCEAGLMDLMESSSTNSYDRTMLCPPSKGEEKGWDCYPKERHLETFLNGEMVQRYLEIEKEATSKVANFSLNSDIIMSRYTRSGDFGTSSTTTLQRIINDEGVDVLIYIGSNDWIVTALGTSRMFDRMRFNGYAKFRAQKKAELEWTTKEGKSAGTVKTIDGLWFVEVYGAGHLVPHDQPQSALKMIQAWKAKVEGKSSSSGKPSMQIDENEEAMVEGQRKDQVHLTGYKEGL